MHSENSPGWDQLRTHIHGHLKAFFGIEDSTGIEFFILLQRVAHLSALYDTQLGEDRELSAPRWRLLMRLLVDEKLGNCDGVKPTDLSRSQRVSKNTISALLRGLETQGLIRRTVDAADLRAFRIQLTPAGRDYLAANAPQRMVRLNGLLDGLEPEERTQLTTLLERLQVSLARNCQHFHEEPDAAATAALERFPVQE